MDALILAAGFGTRLGKYAANLPKPLLEISGVPLLETNIEKMKKNKIKSMPGIKSIKRLKYKN